MFKVRTFITGILTVLLLFICSTVYASEEDGEEAARSNLHDVAYDIVEEEHIPDALERWVIQSQKKALVQTRVVGDATYVYITRGMKHSGGYEVEIVSVQRDESDQTLKVEYRLIDPGKSDFVTEELTYPSILIRIDEPLKGDIEYREAEGRDIEQLDNVTYLPEIYAESDNIMLLPPAVREENVYLQGFIRGFEGVVNVKLLNQKGKVQWEQTESASKGAPIWGRFEIVLPDQWNDMAELEVSIQIAVPQMQVKTEQLTLSLNELQNHLVRLSNAVKS